MVASMTGFGRGEAEENGYHVSVELRAVNGRYGEVMMHMPRSLSGLEARIKDIVLATVSRGRVDVTLTVHGDGSGQGVPVLNQAVVDAYKTELTVLKEKLELAGEFDLT